MGRIVFLFLLFPCCLWGQTDAGSVTDRDGHSYTLRGYADSSIWMTQNLNLKIPGSYCYDNSAKNCAIYGRLYTWDAANKVCQILGEGWRLPSNEEWKSLADLFGGLRENPPDSGKSTFRAFLKDSLAHFDLQFGGGREDKGTYARLNAHGFYWTSSATGTNTAWLYNVGTNGKTVNRHSDMEKFRAASVRCIRSSRAKTK